MKVIGITGRMGMGKSTISRLIAKAGYSVLSADEIVRKIYEKDEHFIETLKTLYPFVFCNGKFDKVKLRSFILSDPKTLDKLNKILHPIVFKHFLRFIFIKKHQHTRFVFLEIPLLFETDFHKLCDKVIVVSAPRWIQMRRIKERGLPRDFVNFLLSRQCPEKLQRTYGDIIINTGLSFPQTKRSVRQLLTRLEV